MGWSLRSTTGEEGASSYPLLAERDTLAGAAMFAPLFEAAFGLRD